MTADPGPTSANSLASVDTAAPAIEMVAVDLDGTLLDDSKRFTQRTADALIALRHRNIRLVIASARPPRSIRHIYAALSLDTLQVNYNGALIWDEPNKVALFHRPIDSDIVRKIIHFARALDPDLLVTCEVMDRWHTDRHDPKRSTETGRLFQPDVIAPIEEICVTPITKLLLLGNEKTLAALAPQLEQEFSRHVSWVQTEPHLLQIMDRRVSKGRAVEQVAAHYGIPMSRVLAIGDAPNDVAMLQLSGIAVAVANGHESVKRVADWIAPSNNDQGVYATLQKYGLVSGR